MEANAVAQTPSVSEKEGEHPLELIIGSFEDETPSTWGKPLKMKEIPLEEDPFKVCYYANKLMVFSHDDEIQLVAALDGCCEKGPKGVRNNDSEEAVLAAYGAPSKVLNMTQGISWIYKSQGIAFWFTDNKVRSWMLFDN